MKLKSIPMLVTAFEILIVGLIILVYGIFYMKQSKYSLKGARE